MILSKIRHLRKCPKVTYLAYETILVSKCHVPIPRIAHKFNNFNISVSFL